MNKIVLSIVLILIGHVVSSEEETEVVKERYKWCDVSIFSVPKFLVENYILVIPYMIGYILEKLIRNEDLVIPDAYLALPIYWLFIVPFKAVFGISQFSYCLLNGHLQFNELHLIRNGENP